METILSMIRLLLGGADVVIAVPTLYLALLTAASFLYRSPRGAEKRSLRILALIPAHDEERNVGKTISSLLNDKAAPHSMTIAVIADNCTDSTARVAREAGAVVVERNAPENPGKGQALDFFLKTQAELLREHDAVTIVDADTTVAKGYGKAMASALSDPSIQAVQAYYDVANPFDGWRNTLMSAALRPFHHLRPAGRNMLGGTAGLKGNGMAFSSELLLRTGWPAKSVVEDMEFSLLLLEQGVLVHYVPEACVYGEMPAQAKDASKQRMRWEGGRFAMVKAHAPGLFLRLVRTWRWREVDALLDLATPPLSLLLLAQVVLLGIAAVAWPGSIWLPAVLLGVTASHILAGLVQTRAPLRIWLALVAAPFFLAWKLAIYARLLGRQRLEWTRSSRNSDSQRGKL